MYKWMNIEKNYFISTTTKEILSWAGHIHLHDLTCSSQFPNPG